MSDRACCICEVERPDFLCLCEEVSVCNKCISQHLTQNPTPTHKPLPLDCPELIQAVRDEVIESQQSTLATECPEMYHEKRKVMRRLLLKEISRVQAFKVATEVKLQQTKRLLEQQLAGFFVSTLEALNRQVDDARKSLARVLSEMMSSDPLVDRLWKEGRSDEDEMVDLTCEIKTIDLPAFLKPNLQFEVHSIEESEQAVLFKFFGGMKQVGVFEAKTESFARMIPSTGKFFHNSSSCLTPSGIIYLTGGSLTGRSRSDAASFNPQTGQVVILQPMHTARRSHASIWINNACYVFGGLMEDDRCSLCEKFTQSQDAWMSISNMLDRRAYLGCCLYQSKVFLCGGAASPSCEVFTPSTETFTMLQLRELGLEDNCCLAALEDSLLVFYGSYQGQVLRYFPESGEVRRLKDMCYGNSWSSCAPIVYKRVVFLLRSESIFKYNYDTEESAYVLRMSKSAQRGPEL